MPRLPRIHVPGGFYHVMLRGNHREELFDTAADRQRLNDIVATVIERLNVRVHAFCWMTNHIHLLMQVGDQPLGKVMQRIASRYSRYRHRHLHTTGHLFERRYKAKLVDADAYLFALLRYIHLNPVTAGIVTTPDEYPWSSHHAYIGRESIPWLTIDFGLSLFSARIEQARHAYASLMGQPVYVSETRLLDDGHPEDPRILGSDRFLAQLPPFQPIRKKSALTLDELVTAVCNTHHTSPLEIRSASRKRSLTPVRIEIAQRALRERIANLREVAEYLRRDPSSLSELLLRHDSTLSPSL